MSEHTPLTEAEREALDEEFGDAFTVAWADAIERILFGRRTEVLESTTNVGALRTSTATADERRRDDEAAGRSYPGHACPEHGPRCVGPTCCCRDLHAPTATADTGLRERVEALLADEWHDEPPSPTYPEGRRIYRWPADLRDDLCAALDATAAPSLDLRARVKALADDLWRVAPCGCGHRADLHTMGGVDGVSVCTGGLGICGCEWSFVRIVQQRIRDLLATAAPTADTGARDE